MFTGLIQAVGTVIESEPRGTDLRIGIETGKLEMQDTRIGDSIAVNGVCLTVVRHTGDRFWADVSVETLRLTGIGRLKTGDPVNLEKALTLATPLGGHLVSGHVDGIGEVVARSRSGRATLFSIKAPDELARYIAVKGSICVDGTSLTVNGVSGAVFELTIVPHTLKETIMDSYRVGHRVNLEVDIIARYLERLLLGEEAANPGAQRIDVDFLRRHGFLK